MEKTNINGQAAKTIENKKLIMTFLAKKDGSKASDIAEYLGLSAPRTRVLLAELIQEKKIKPDGNGRARIYRLWKH